MPRLYARNWVVTLLFACGRAYFVFKPGVDFRDRTLLHTHALAQISRGLDRVDHFLYLPRDSVVPNMPLKSHL